MLVDTHCHIQFQGYKNDREAVIERCRAKGTMLNLVGTQKDTSRLAVELAEKYDWMFASIGTHPNHLFPTHIDEEESHFVSREEDFDEAYYEKLVQSKKVVAIGECGLDLFHLPPNVPLETVLEKQKRVFMAHFQFAQKHDKALVIHCRDAHDQLIELLKELINRISPPMRGGGGGVRGVVHCYTSNWTHAEEYIKMGLCLGFTGVITFPPKKSDPQAQHDLLEVVKNVPMDRFVLETDSPYLAPIPYRGTRAEPWMVEAVAKKISEVKMVSIEEVEKASTENAKNLFKFLI
ncbi:MAG: TatD family hydrolase [Patescibacteria group bacterium]